MNKVTSKEKLMGVSEGVSKTSGYRGFMEMPLLSSILSRKGKNSKNTSSQKMSVDSSEPKNTFVNANKDKKINLSTITPESTEKIIVKTKSVSKNLDDIYNFMRMEHTRYMKNMRVDGKYQKKLDKIRESRTKELIELFSGKRVENQRKKQVRAEIEQLKKQLNELKKKQAERKEAEKPTTPSTTETTLPEVIKPTVPPKPASVPKPEVKPPATKTVEPTTPVTPKSPAPAPVSPPAPVATPAPVQPVIKPTVREVSPSKPPTIKREPEVKTVTKAPEVKVSAETAKKVTGAAIGGVVLSTAAIATIKSEQGVKSAEDAISPNNSVKRVKLGEFADITTPKVGAATPDTNKSTSYGLFGLNNRRAVDKKTGQVILGSSSIDNFVKTYPELKLPDPGDPTNPEQVKTFNQAWWNLAKNKPEELFATQMQHFKKKYEEPAAAGLKNKTTDEIANNQKVIDFMTDRRIQFGGALLESALSYAKNAKTPEEFINLVTEHDLKNLRQIFKSTSDSEFTNLKIGLIKRLRDRQLTATGKTNIPDTMKERDKLKGLDVGEQKLIQKDTPKNVGEQIDSTTRETNGMKREQKQQSTGANINILNNTRNIVHGSRIHESPDESTNLSPALQRQFGY